MIVSIYFEEKFVEDDSAGGLLRRKACKRLEVVQAGR
jgi:hypothetical protein